MWQMRGDSLSMERKTGKRRVDLWLVVVAAAGDDDDDVDDVDDEVTEQ